MTISSALNAGVQGLTVNSTRLATISDNIANSATNGYIRSDVDFSSLVINQRSNTYSAGGVSASTYKDISAQRAFTQTTNSTDISITGSGLIPVTTQFGITDSAESREFLLTPTGSFREDDEGFLQTPGGLYLLGWPIDVNTGEPITGGRDSANGLVPVNVNVQQLSAEPTQNISLGLNLPAAETQTGSTGNPIELPIQYFDNIGASETLTFNFTPTVPGAGSSNQWTVSVTDTATGGVVGDFTLEFSTTAADGGRLATITAGAGTTYDAATGEITLTAGSGPIDVFIGSVGEAGGITQFAADYAPTNITKDGAAIGELQDIEVSEQGIVSAIFNSGSRRALFQIPVGAVPNENGLRAISNQAFTLSQESGDIFLWDAGTGPVGSYRSFTLMESTTDIASELTNLIQTQRAYSSNATIIQTVDEMLQETTNLKR